MNIPQSDILNAVLRSDFEAFQHRCFLTAFPGVDFLPNWHMRVMADKLMDCLRGGTKRLIITLPPRNLKSQTASVALPAFILGHDPTSRVVCASYSGDLAGKFSRDCRAVMQSDWYQSAFGTRLDPGKITEAEFTTTKRGYRLAASVGAMLTGRGGNFIIIDDPLNATDTMSEVKRQAVIDWYSNTLLSRLDNKAEDVIIIVAQRLHYDDLVGHLLRSGEEWVHLNLPAIAEERQYFTLANGVIVGREAGEALHPGREPLDVLQNIKTHMGSYVFSAQYQQDPLPLEGGMIKWPWFKTYSSPLERQQGDFVTQSWDTASKKSELNDYSVCMTVLRRGSDHYLIDIFRERLEYPDLKRAVVRLADHFRADAVLIEDKGSGTSLIQDLQEEGIVRPIGILPEGDKESRMYARTAMLEAGYVWLPEAAAWLDDFRTEVLQFPTGRHDDQIDSLSQYLGWGGWQMENLSGMRFSHGIMGDQGFGWREG